jgi:hypothetical protein
MPRDQTAARRCGVRITNISFEGAEELKYLGKNLMNLNSIQEEIKGRSKSGNACYHSVQ